MRIVKASLAATCLAAIAVGCADKTEGERTLDKSQRYQEAGIRMTEGEQMVRDGVAKEAAGRKAREQGDLSEGDRMIADGVAQQKAGRAKIDEARKLRDAYRP
jgi:hypothetical protein